MYSCTSSALDALVLLQTVAVPPKEVLDFCLERNYPGIYTVKTIKMLTFKLGFFLLM